MGVHCTRGEPNETKKNTRPFDVTASFWRAGKLSAADAFSEVTLVAGDVLYVIQVVH